MTEPLRTLGRYTLKRRLAAGGMGEVYLGEVQGAANFTKQVAIKRILPHLAANQAFVAKFIDEANLMVQLHHGNIVPVLELADADGELFIVMEYLPGRDLKAVLARLKSQRRPFPVDLALWVTTEICNGLDYAHRRTGIDGHPLHIVHRDVSPSNVMLGAAGEVKLVDFGIARARGGLHQSITGTLQGKFSYMSPEQAEGLSIDARSDVFAAGLVLYEMLTGVRPLEGESETDTLRKVRQAKIPRPSSHRDELTAELDGLALQALAAAPDARFATASAFRREISGLLSRTGSQADASTLSRFLGEIFPEGVVPLAGDPGPLSMDDALKLQLGSLTPSVDSMGHTRTATGPIGPPPKPATFSTGPRVEDAGATPARPGSAPRPPASTSPGPQSGSQPVITQPAWPQPRPTLGRRALVLLALPSLLLAGGYVWSQRPVPATLEVATVPALPARLKITVDGRPLETDLSVHADDHVIVCAQARDFKPACREFKVRGGENRLTLTLEPLLALVKFVAEPPQTTVVVEGVPLPFAQGTQQNIELGNAVKVLWSAEGFKTLEKTYNLQDLPDRTLRERLEPAPATGLSTAPPAQPATQPPTLPPTQPPPTNLGRGTEPAARVRTLELVSSPPGAHVFEGDRALGKTPVAFPAPHGRTILTFKLSGHSPVSREIDASTASPVRVDLAENQPGFISVRVEPARGTLLLDGRDLGTNVLSGRVVPAGEHTLQARFLDRESPPQHFTLEVGQRLQLAPIDLTRPEDQEQPDE